MQTSYRLNKDADLRLPTRYNTFFFFNQHVNFNTCLLFNRTIFPLGVPSQFSFVTTFRTRKLAKSPWNIIRLTDSQNRPQFLVTLNPRRETIEFSIANHDGKLETVTFRQSQVFDKNWHKIHFGVYHQRLFLYVDCKEIGSEQLEPRGPIDMNGEVAISKLAYSQQTFPVRNFLKFR